MTQIAASNFASRGEWYAYQQICPHKKSFVLSRGIIGDVGGTSKVAYPTQKKAFSLELGDCITGEEYEVDVFPVKVEGGMVHLKLPTTEVLDEIHATEPGYKRATACREQTDRDEQQRLTAVQEYRNRHESDRHPDQSKYYKRLLPTAKP